MLMQSGPYFMSVMQSFSCYRTFVSRFQSPDELYMLFVMRGCPVSYCHVHLLHTAVCCQALSYVQFSIIHSMHQYH